MSFLALPALPPSRSPALAGLLEAAEAEAWFDFHRAGPAPLRRELGAGAVETGAGRLCRCSRLDVLALNRVLGAGLDRPLDLEALREVERIFGAAGTPRFFLPLAPHAEPFDAGATLRSRGYRLYNHWIRMVREATELPAPPTDLVVRDVGTPDAAAFGDVVTRGFGWDTRASQWVAATVGRPGWRHFLAWDGNTPVASGALYRSGSVAWTDFAATLPSHRGRGAQSALLAHRVNTAAELGCRWVTLETADDRDGRPSPSYRNAHRCGFEPLYRRPNYLLQLS